MTSNLVESLERRELIQKLVTASPECGELIEILMAGGNKVYTKKGRLNKSGTCRALGWKPKQLEDVLIQCREILGTDIF